MAAEGGYILCWDLKLGGKYDLTVKRNQQLIFGWIRGAPSPALTVGRIAAVGAELETTARMVGQDR